MANLKSVEEALKDVTVMVLGPVPAKRVRKVKDKRKPAKPYVSPAQIQLAYEWGEQAALSLQVGDRFLGAWGAAAKLGIENTQELRPVFTYAFLKVIDRKYPFGVPCDEDGVIQCDPRQPELFR